MELTFKNNAIYYYHYKIGNGELSWVLVPLVLALIYYFNSYIKYVSLNFLLFGIVGLIDSYNKSKREQLLGILIGGLIMHIAGFYPLLNVKSHFAYNNIIYVFGLIALAIVYYLPYWPYTISRTMVALIIGLLYLSYTLYHINNIIHNINTFFYKSY
jgi:hypothetical protein